MPIEKKTLKQDKPIAKERIKCGKCGKKLFDLHLIKESGFVELTCYACKDLVVLLPPPPSKQKKKKKIIEDDKPKIQKPKLVL